MIFAALILLAFLALALVCVDRWQETEHVIRGVREEFGVPRD